MTRTCFTSFATVVLLTLGQATLPMPKAVAQVLPDLAKPADPVKPADPGAWLTFAATDVNAARFYNRVRIARYEAIVALLGSTFTEDDLEKATGGLTLLEYNTRVHYYANSPLSIKMSGTSTHDKNQTYNVLGSYMKGENVQESQFVNNTSSNIVSPRITSQYGLGDVTHDSPLFLTSAATNAHSFDDYGRLYGGTMFIPNTGITTFIFVGSAPVNRHDVIRPVDGDHTFHPDPADPKYQDAAPDYVYATDFYENWSQLHRGTATNFLARLKQQVEIEPFIGLSTQKISDKNPDDGGQQAYTAGVSIILNPYINFPIGAVFSKGSGKDHLDTRLGVGIGIDLGTLTSKIFGK